MTPTTEINQTPPKISSTLAEVLADSRGSPAGYTAVSTWLTCPERSRLASLGLRRRDAGFSDDTLSDLDLGTISHKLREIRLWFGHDTLETTLQAWSSELSIADYEKIKMLFRVYDQKFPLATEPFQVLGVELEVITDLSGNGDLRTVRYDTVIRDKQFGDLFSLEAKTTSRSGWGAMRPYIPQGMCQTALWNYNNALREKYGAMRGVIFDTYIKTKVPDCDRLGPTYFSKAQQALAQRYMLLPGNGAQFGVGQDGKYPQMLHACWGRYRPCDFIGICHDQAYGDFQMRNGTVYAGR